MNMLRDYAHFSKPKYLDGDEGIMDYQKHRERLTRARNSLTRPHLRFDISDAEELLDKAEKWDKVNEGLAVDGIHTSPGLLKELFELREKVEERHKVNLSERDIEFLKKIEVYLRGDKEGEYTTLIRGTYEDWLIDMVKRLGGISDPAPVEEGKG